MRQKVSILLLGRGGRESALASKLLESPRLECLHTAPGYSRGAIHADLDPFDFQAIADYCEANDIDLVAVGPEALIVGGIFDFLSERGIAVVAPSRECGRLEGSKEYGKEFMSQHGIPTPRFMTVTSETLDEGIEYLESRKPPYVVKADGLAAGKGVMITDSLEEAKFFMHEMLDGMFEESSHTVVIEEFVEGNEVSLFLAVSGDDYKILTSARDYKRLRDGDKGPNTAGMGSVSPSPDIDGEFIEKVKKRIIRPTLAGLKESGMEYKGFLYLGLMDCQGFPMLLEYNVRLGDPETQAIIPLMKSDLIDLLEGILEGNLDRSQVEFAPGKSIAVVISEKGYPSQVEKGALVEGLNSAHEGVIVFPGSVKYDAEGRCYVAGGRVATSVGLGSTYCEACRNAIEGAEAVAFSGKYYRTDIGKF